jgi:hypothetical protein
MKQRVTQNERHDSRAGNETLFEEEDPEMNMRQLLNDPESFKEKFCSRLTTRNLADIQLDNLRQVLLKIHEIVEFNAVNTPEKWTPEGSPQPVVCIGCMKGGGKGQIKMMDPRFGICTDARAQATSGATGLYLWVDHRALDDLPETHRPFALKGSPFNWRSGEDGPADTVQRFYRLSEPLYSLTGDHKDLTQLPVEGSRRVIGLPDLLKELGKLLTSPTKTAVQSAAPYAQRLGLAPGCYTPAAIGAFNEA